MSDTPRVNSEAALRAMWDEIKDNPDPPKAISDLLTFAVGRGLSAQALILEPSTSKIAVGVSYNACLLYQIIQKYPEYDHEKERAILMATMAEIQKKNKNISGGEVIDEILKLLDQKKTQA